MKNKIFNNDVEANVSEEEIILAPPTELFDEAKKISQNTKSDEKFPFVLHYDINQKEFLLSILSEAGVIVEKDDDKGHTLSTIMNMTQLAFVKRLDCVKRVKTDERINPFLADEAINLTPTIQQQSEFATNRTTNTDLKAAQITEEYQENDGIAIASETASVKDSRSSYSCAANTSMASAETISDESYTSGYIGCPGAEQWFKFIATRNGQYTICTTGDLDTIGALYDYCGNLIEEVDDYEPCGKINFRIIRNLTAGNTYYLKVRVSGDDTGSYTLRVTEKAFVNCVTINKSTIILEKGVLYELPLTPNYTYKGYNGARPISGLSVSIDPSNANEQRIWWWEQNSDILKCYCDWDDDGDMYAHVIASEAGTSKLYADDWNEDGKRAECMVYVGGAPVTGISLDRSRKIVSLYNTEQLTAIITPTNALNKGVTWNSSNWNVVDVNSNGVITGLKVGTATVTATTNDGGYIATCVVSVDRREKVTIKKDSHSFYVEFNDGNIWKNIGIDLSKREENYNQTFPPNMWYDNYDYLIEEEQRYFDNIYVEENGVMIYKTYSVRQIAYLYLLDPLGIEYYMRNHACHDKDIMSGEFLSYKDEVYEAIFGNSERLSGRFYFTIVDGSVRYGRYSGAKRMDVYSNAEVLFGSHTIFNFDALMNHILKEVFTSFIPDYSYIQLGVKLCQAMFFSGAIVGTGTNAAANLITDYVENEVQSAVHSLLGWVGNYLDYLNTVTNIIDVSFDTMNSNDINIFIKTNESTHYSTVFDTSSLEVTINELIQKHNE